MARLRLEHPGQWDERHCPDPGGGRERQPYAGGDFTTAGGVTANRIAKWDGTTSSWSALGSGMNSTVRALAVDGGGNLYAGGDFTTAGGVTANYIAKWDGTTSSWSALGSGMNSAVFALTMDGSGNLYAGGRLTTAGGVPANRIAKWTAADGRAIAGPGTYTFYTNNLPVTIVVPPGGQGDLARIILQRFDKSHANAGLVTPDRLLLADRGAQRQRPDGLGLRRRPDPLRTGLHPRRE